MNTTRLTAKGKVAILILILIIAAVALYFTGSLDGLLGKENVPSMNFGSDNDGEAVATPTDGTINLSLDEWIGWKSVLDANGGLETQPGSIYDKLGLKVNINVINDATQSSNALIKGSLQGAGYTVNRYAFLNAKFVNANVPTVMPYVTNFSTGGDGIIAQSSIKSIEGLVGKKIAVPRYSEAQTLTMWLISQSSMTDAQKKQVVGDIVYFDTPDDAAKAFFAGKVDAAATWQPYLSQAQESSDSRVLFSTKTAHNIILDGMVFRKDFYDANQDSVAKIIEGALQAADMYTTDFTAIKEFPLFSTETDENIKAMTADATLASYADNKKLLGGVAQLLFINMSDVWSQLGEEADSSQATADAAFDSKAIESLTGKFSEIAEKKPVYSAAQKQEAVDSTALLKKTCTIEFKSNMATFVDPTAAAAVLDEFAATAKIIDGAIIQVEGNIADISNKGKATAGGKQLSYMRAKAVADYMIRYQGIDPQRFVIIGNGVSKQIAKNDTEAHQRLNRRTDIFFKVVE